VSLPVAILAGGLATRLRPVTDTIPKALVEVAGRPFAEYQIEWLKDQGVSRIVFLVAHLGGMIQDALGDGRRWKLSIEYVFDGPDPLGTGGALKRAQPRLGEAFVVLYGDSLLDCDLAAIEDEFVRSRRAGLMTVFRNDNRWDSSNVLYENGQVRRYDKRSRTTDMRHIDYGLGILAARALAPFSTDRPFDLSDVYQRLSADGDLAAFEATNRFYEIGSPEGLDDTRTFLAQRRRNSISS
jgi:NDP-sugar pyrophosphorylase family protein